MVAVAVPSAPPQHSPMFGQRASSHTVESLFSRTVCRIRLNLRRRRVVTGARFSLRVASTHHCHTQSPKCADVARQSQSQSAMGFRKKNQKAHVGPVGISVFSHRGNRFRGVLTGRTALPFHGISSPSDSAKSSMAGPDSSPARNSASRSGAEADFHRCETARGAADRPATPNPVRTRRPTANCALMPPNVIGQFTQDARFKVAVHELCISRAILNTPEHLAHPTSDGSV